MAQLIEWTADFQAELRQIDQKTAHRILRSIARFVYHQQGDVLKLQGIDPPAYRLRVGEYRVQFRRKGRGILLFRVSTRQGAY